MTLDRELKPEAEFTRASTVFLPEDMPHSGASDDSPAGLTICNRLVLAEMEQLGVRKKDRPNGSFVLKKGKQKYRINDGAILRYFNPRFIRRICKNKDITSRVLRDFGAHTPENCAFAPDDVARAWAWAQPILPVVLKPVDGRRGEQVFIGIREEAEFMALFADIAGTRGRVLVEQFLEGTEYRFFYLTGEILAVTQRVPANVLGDGITDIAGLVAAKTAERHARADPIHKDLVLDPEALRVLAQQGVTPETILPEGQRAFLRLQSNISTGGDAVDATDAIDPAIKAHITDVCRCIDGLNVAGVDVIVKDGHVSILEVNCKPMVTMHHAPWEGQPRVIAPLIARAMFP
ncbi:MAG: hypothetical protein JJU24_19475 [Natronohydrobacter sp.]|nr:hypothetical protein [Natronohydrobacter sp.]